MAENIVVNDVTYNGVAAVAMETASGDTVLYYPDAVRYNPQTLTDAQKAQARDNMGITGTGKDGADGQRGTGLLPVTTAPSSYTTAVGGITPKYRMAISTIKTQSGATEVLLGDTIRYSYYHYPIAYLDASYAYCTTRTSIRGATGSAGTTPVKGTDYFTATDKAEMISELADKLSLGIASDGLIYLFVDGNPVGTGIPMGNSGDVVGTLDESNNILLSGDLDEGTYPLKWLLDDGTYKDAGTLTVALTPEPEPIINWVTNSINADGTPFIGTNGEKGYKTGYRISASSGNESAQSGVEVTGFIPAKQGDIMYVKGITSNSGSTNVLGFYNSKFEATKTAGAANTGAPMKDLFGGAVNGELRSVTLTKANMGNNNFNEDVAYIRVSADIIDSNSIITINQPIE